MKNIITFIFVLSAYSFCSAELQKDSPIEYIKKESIGGQLDFMKKLEAEGKSKKLIPYEGAVYSSNDYVIIRWAEEVHKLGIRSPKEAMDLWQFIYQRDLSHDEIKVFKKGFKIKPRS